MAKAIDLKKVQEGSKLDQEIKKAFRGIFDPKIKSDQVRIVIKRPTFKKP